jgi:hypothetical protein
VPSRKVAWVAIGAVDLQYRQVGRRRHAGDPRRIPFPGRRELDRCFVADHVVIGEDDVALNEEAGAAPAARLDGGDGRKRTGDDVFKRR